jgi:hypothetical protein
MMNTGWEIYQVYEENISKEEPEVYITAKQSSLYDGSRWKDIRKAEIGREITSPYRSGVTTSDRRNTIDTMEQIDMTHSIRMLKSITFDEFKLTEDDLEVEERFQIYYFHGFNDHISHSMILWEDRLR